MLHQCPDCGKQVSDRAFMCPNCGWAPDGLTITLRPPQPTPTPVPEGSKKPRRFCDLDTMYREPPTAIQLYRYVEQIQNQPFVTLSHQSPFQIEVCPRFKLLVTPEGGKPVSITQAAITKICGAYHQRRSFRPTDYKSVLKSKGAGLSYILTLIWLYRTEEVYKE